MYRITTSWHNARIILYRHRIDIHLAYSSRAPGFDYSAKERETCPPTPPPSKPKPRDDSLLWGALTVVCLAGGFAAYAKRSPEIRDWLTIHAPWFDDMIAVMYEENMSYKEYIEKCIEDAQKYIKNYFVQDQKPKECSSKDIPPPAVRALPEQPKVEAADVPASKPTEDGSCVVIPPPVLTKNICEVETCLKEFGDTAIQNYTIAKNVCVSYNDLVEKTMLNFSIPKVKELHAKMAERIDAVKLSVENAVHATAQMDELTRYIDCGVEAPPSSIKSTKCLMKDYHQKIKAVTIQYHWENDMSLALDKKWQKVESLVEKYTDENETMFSGLKYEKLKLQLNGDPDLLLHHTNRYLQKLKTELNETVAGMTERVNRGIEKNACRLIPFVSNFSSDDGIHEESRKILKLYRNICDFDIFSKILSIYMQNGEDEGDQTWTLLL